MFRVLARRTGTLLSLGVLAVTLMLASTRANADALDLARAGFAAKERHDYARAIQFFDEAIRLGNFDKERYGFLIYSRGVSYEGLGIRDKALADFDAAIALLPNFPNSYIYRGLIWAYEREYDRAIEDFLHARKLSPNDPMILNNLGGAYEKKGDLDRAIKSYNEAVRLQPAYAEAYYNRAEAFLAKGDRERALSDYDQAIWLQPNFPDAFGNRGAVHLMLGHFDKAVADFGSAIKLRPQDAIFWANRANANLTIGNYAAALADFDQALRVSPGNPAIYLGRGRARLFAGDISASIDDFKTAVRLRPSNPYPVIWLHIARVHAGEDDRAELAENSAKVKRDIWPTSLLDYYLGIIDSARIRAAARVGPAREQGKRTCEADFFLSESIAHTSQPNEARKLLQDIIEECKAYDVVYGGAVAELKLFSK